MRNGRFVFALLIAAGAALAACSGNFGSGASAPGGLLPSGPLSGIAPTPSPTPNTANDIVTYGDSSAFQPLPEVEGYGGAIAFEVPNPRPSGFSAVPIGATLSVERPDDTPDLNLATPGKNGKKRERPARALAYITLIATRDITLSSYPRIAVDVPRDIVVTYQEAEINLALYNAGQKDKTYRLAVAEHDTSATPPPRATAPPTALPSTTAIPVSAGTPSPGASASPTASPAGSPSPVPTPSVSPTLPPQRILFAATAAELKLAANQPVVFAVYALPIESPSPAASGSASPAATGSAAAGPAASAAATGAASPAASPVASLTPAPPTPSP